MENEIIVVVPGLNSILTDWILVEWLESYGGENNGSKSRVVWEQIVRSWERIFWFGDMKMMGEGRGKKLVCLDCGIEARFGK